MRRQVKSHDSLLRTGELRYSANNSSENKKIVELLLAEQKQFCAYTEQYIGRADTVDLEHFNPTLKHTALDGYDNWFAVKHQWNLEKASKWEDYQPVMDPTAADFDSRIIYIEGDYVLADDTDLPAANLVKLLKLDDIRLAEDRKRYINRKKNEWKAMGGDAESFFKILYDEDPARINFVRAISEEFGIDLWSVLV